MRLSNTAELFDQPSVRLRNPDAAFDAWLNSKRRVPGSQHGLRSSTVRVYGAMWRSFVRWCDERSLSLKDVHRSHIDQYLSVARTGKAITFNHGLRYRRILESVFWHWQLGDPLGSSDDRSIHPRPEYSENAPTPFLKSADRKTLDDFLRRTEGKVLPSSALAANISADAWLAARDRTMVATFLGCGLKVGELISLKATDIHLNAGTVRVASSSDALRTDHLAIVLPHSAAAALLPQWLERARDLAPFSYCTTLVFSGFDPAPGLRHTSNRPALNGMLNPATIHRAVKRVIASAGIADPLQRISAQTLRNTYAACLIEEASGVTSPVLISRLCQNLGLQRRDSAVRLIAQYEQWKRIQDSIG